MIQSETEEQQGRARPEVKDTIVIPAHPNGFSEVFIGEKRWPNLKIDSARKKEVRYIAVYQTKPISAITHYAEVDKFIPLERKGRYTVVFRGDPKAIDPVRFTSSDVCAIQGPRYTLLKRILRAKSLSEAF